MAQAVEWVNSQRLERWLRVGGEFYLRGFTGRDERRSVIGMPIKSGLFYLGNYT